MLGVDEQVLRPEGAAEGSQAQTAEPCRPWYSLNKSVRALLGARRGALHRSPSGRAWAALSLPGASRCALAPGYLIPRLQRSVGQLLISLVFFSAVLLCLPSIDLAKEAKPVEDPQIDQRMQALTQQLRCLVCQNETLADSRADLAEDLRREIRKEIKAGKTDPEIIAFLTQRYGDFILYNPPVKRTTYLLWFGPFVILLGGIAVLYRYLGRRKHLIQDNPLTAGERKQAEHLLRGQA